MCKSMNGIVIPKRLNVKNMATLPAIHELRECVSPVIDSSKVFIQLELSSSNDNNSPEIDEALEKIQMQIETDKNWKLHKGFADSTKMAYFLPIHELLCTKTPNLQDVKAEIEQRPHSLLAQETSYQRVPLHIACRMGAPDEVILAVLSRCPDAAKLQDTLGRLPLHYACANNASFDVISKLIEAFPAGCKQPCNQGWLPLHIAVSAKREYHLATMLLFQYPEGVVQKTKGGNTPLTLAQRMDESSGDNLYAKLVNEFNTICESRKKAFNAVAA